MKTVYGNEVRVDIDDQTLKLVGQAFDEVSALTRKASWYPKIEIVPSIYYLTGAVEHRIRIVIWCPDYGSRHVEVDLGYFGYLDRQWKSLSEGNPRRLPNVYFAREFFYLDTIAKNMSFVETAHHKYLTRKLARFGRDIIESGYWDKGYDVWDETDLEDLTNPRHRNFWEALLAATRRFDSREIGFADLIEQAQHDKY